MRKVCLMVVLLVVSTAPVAAQVPTQGMCDTKKSQATTERSLASTKYSEYVALADAAATSAGLAQAEFTAKWNQISPADRLLITGYLDYVATKLSPARLGRIAVRPDEGRRWLFRPPTTASRLCHPVRRHRMYSRQPFSH